MNGRTKRLGGIASAVGLLAAGVMLGVAPTANAAVGPSGCSAYVSHTNDHVAVGWCSHGNGTWYVQAKCGGPGRVNGPYKGDQGYRKLSREKASTLNCGTSGYPLEMKVVNVKA
ncbi:hypothetical protein [Streptomyces sp. NPDC059991]|uniref:hypothetical protein n=1 Tax=unclassified Streptomyces TaxID=2593676 RepID=UPI0036C94AC8